ncbi:MULTISPECIES: hypothetical protein [Okeania]|uniref:hypothetical protein n=1 Tax=Okeania TaxID=1458928 RepID=UPI000F538EEB|nr:MULTISPECIES: hypothetical protein [Okeania]NEP89274.1 hypothetical protein [Okeania sp. SIO2C2]NES75190.1 hypothetical protein [Okeania sp. SIO1H4]NET19352.1 hypothetical protein [Okeania sp. SIO1H5]NET92947.1 hypothetical protein [Okeania sp. SIO1H2]
MNTHNKKLVVVHSNGRECVGRWGPTPNPDRGGEFGEMGGMGSMGEIKKYISSPKPMQDYQKI